jgi:hypothetical protein
MNIQSALRTAPGSCKNVSLAVLFGSNGNSDTVFTESDMYVYTHFLHNINAGRAKKKKGTATNAACRRLSCRPHGSAPLPPVYMGLTSELIWVLWRREAFSFLYKKSNHSRPARSRVTNTTPVPDWSYKCHKSFSVLCISMIIDTISFCVKTKIYSPEQSSGPPSSTVWFKIGMLHFPEDKAAGAWHWLSSLLLILPVCLLTGP